MINDKHHWMTKNSNIKQCLRAHSHEAQLSRTELKHDRPPSPLPRCLHSHCCSRTAPEHPWANLICGVRPVFSNTESSFFYLVIKFLNCSVVSAIKKTAAEFSAACYLDLFCCCLPEFKVNPPQTVMVMSALGACARTVPKSTSSNCARADKTWTERSH